jgi:hypothetical protein
MSSCSASYHADRIPINVAACGPDCYGVPFKVTKMEESGPTSRCSARRQLGALIHRVLYLFALPLMLVGQSSAQVQLSKSVTVEVRDAFTDEAIVGAPVLLRDTQAIQSTDASGRVECTGLPLSTSQVIFFISPRGYAPGLRVITTDRKRQTVVVQVVPGEQYKLTHAPGKLSRAGALMNSI